MIINRNFKNNKKVEKAAALLALTADKGEGHYRCLLAEEMAALVDAKCEKQELAIFMRHLSGCEECYAEWLTLKKMADHNSGKGRVYRLSRIKKYSFIGSALALAASVVVFLNISHPPYTFLDNSLEDEVLKQPKSESVTPQFKVDTEDMDVGARVEQAVPMAPVATDSLQKERQENREIPTDVGEASRQKLKGLSAPATQSVPRLAKKTAPAEATSDEYTFMHVDVWLEQIQNNCLSGRQDEDFWSEMIGQGKKILEKQAGSFSGDKEQKVSLVLALLSEMGTESVTEQCRQLLAILAEEEKSR